MSFIATMANCLKIGAAMVPPWRIAAERARMIVAQIDAGDEIGRSADEPNVGRAGGGAGFTEQRPAKVTQAWCAVPRWIDAFHDVDGLIGAHRVDRLL